MLNYTTLHYLIYTIICYTILYCIKTGSKPSITGKPMEHKALGLGFKGFRVRTSSIAVGVRALEGFEARVNTS